MAKFYNSRTVEQNFFERAYKVEIDNAIGTLPVIKFFTEEALSAEGKEQSIKKLRTLQEVYTGNETFDVYHPQTGEVVGQSDYDTVFAQMYSLFFHLATKTDEI